MSKQAVLQVRMDAEIKEQAEELYRSLGTSLAEAVRMFASQSIAENGMPFALHDPSTAQKGFAAKYADPELIEKENDAFRKAMVKKHEDPDRR